MPDDRSFYLGPGRPRLVVGSWGDVVAAAADGLLDEGYWTELKRDVPAAATAANVELAKDLASLSVDGGLFVVGVKDAGGRAGEVVGTDLSGLADRVVQIASARVEPPLPVIPQAFPHPDDPTRGVLFVTVPASLGAPHMVDGRYWGRNDVGKRTLHNDEVRRLLDSRRGRQEGFEDRLRALAVDLDPFPGDDRSQGHLFLLIEPAAGAFRSPLSELVGPKTTLQLVQDAISFSPQWSPNLSGLSYSSPHPDGLLGSYSSPNEAVVEEDLALVALFSDDGAVKVVSCAGTRLYGRGDDPPVAVFTGAVLELVHCAVQIAGHLAAAYGGYHGPWRAGILLDRLEGRRTFLSYAPGYGSGPAYPTREYLKVTETTTAEMLERPEDVVRRLAERLLRTLGDERVFLPYEDAGDIAKRVRR